MSLLSYHLIARRSIPAVLCIVDVKQVKSKRGAHMASLNPRFNAGPRLAAWAPLQAQVSAGTLP
eukprot:SAG31_NODE_4799_length_2952_cov_2.405889_3_plen_64_part_00